MAEVVLGCRIEHRMAGSQHLFTSPDLPGLYVAHADEAVARADIQPAIETLRAMERRRAQKRVLVAAE